MFVSLSHRNELKILKIEIMKTFKLLSLVLVLATSLTSCEKDESDLSADELNEITEDIGGFVETSLGKEFIVNFHLEKDLVEFNNDEFLFPFNSFFEFNFNDSTGLLEITSLEGDIQFVELLNTDNFILNVIDGENATISTDEVFDVYRFIIHTK